MAVLLDFMRELRNIGNSGVYFVHHIGHEGTHLRGSSDLESYWESKLTVRRNDDGDGELTSSHREAEDVAGYKFRFAWDHDTRSVRLRLVEDEQQVEVVAKVAAYYEKHPDASANEVFKAIGGRRDKVLEAVRHVRGEGAIPVKLVPEDES
jgi:hypothetical protein